MDDQNQSIIHGLERKCDFLNDYFTQSRTESMIIFSNDSTIGNV